MAMVAEMCEAGLRRTADGTFRGATIRQHGLWIRVHEKSVGVIIPG